MNVLLRVGATQSLVSQALGGVALKKEQNERERRLML